MKNAQISKMYYQILETMSDSDIVNGYFGGSNLTAEYLNDYSSSAVNGFIGDFLESHGEEYKRENSFVDLIEDPDYLLQQCASEFYSALEYIMPGQGEYLLKKANYHLEPWGKFYLFCSGDTAQVWIIRASNDWEAYNELVTRFEKAFAIDEDDIAEDQEYNDNGTPINTDYLVLLGMIEGK